MERERLIAEIGNLEWPMFESINGAGPKAACQLDEKRYRLMRKCQYDAWSERHLQSWLSDLQKAAKTGRNLVEEKYIRMMVSACPGSAASLSQELPMPERESLKLIEEIVRIHLNWRDDLESSFPLLLGRGRKSHSSEDENGETSFETYLRCELMTSSPETIAIYWEDTHERLKSKKSEAEENLLNQVRKAGFTSLESAENYLQKKV